MKHKIKVLEIPSKRGAVPYEEDCFTYSKGYKDGQNSIHNMSRKACWENGYSIATEKFKGIINEIDNSKVGKDIKEYLLARLDSPKEEKAFNHIEGISYPNPKYLSQQNKLKEGEGKT